jgi:hypothetical protein
LKQIKMIYNISDADLSISERPTKRKWVELVLEDKCTYKSHFTNCACVLTLFNR